MTAVADLLRARGHVAAPVKLGAYPSMCDDVRIEDVARRLDAVVRELQANGGLAERFHIVAHSTGALIVREWIADRFERGEPAPVENFIMLAPANHGSPLAVHGRSVFARLFKGWRNGFQTGTAFLRALELGAAYQERLDLRDRLSARGETAGPYAEDGIRPCVIVGAQPMEVAHIFGESAWDGTVRIAGANFDPHGASIAFSAGEPQPHVTPWTRRGLAETAFAVLPDRSHLSIIQPAPERSASPDAETAGVLADLIIAAIETDGAEDYERLRARCRTVTHRTRALAQNTREGERARKRILSPGDARHPERFHEHYQIVAALHDDAAQPVEDFFLWLSAPSARQLARGLSAARMPDRAEIQAHREILRDCQANRAAPHRRILHLDRMALMRKGGLFRAHDKRVLLAAGLTAAAPGEKIAYFDRNAAQGSGYIPLRAKQSASDGVRAPRFLKRWSTHYLDITAPRAADDDVFKMTDY